MNDNLNLFQGKRVVVTGGLGSIGSKMIEILLGYNPKEIILIDNRETELFYSRIRFPSVTHKMADIREYDIIEKLLKDVDIVFHTAAMKHVGVCEDFPFEAIKTNINGTENIIKSCLENKVDRMMLISTDKAANPTTTMGATKLLGEKMVGSVAIKNKGKTKFGIVRFGNVLNSRGSVLEIWNQQLKEDKKILLIGDNMTRFFMSISQAINLIFKATKFAKDGEVFILKMPSVKIEDLAEVFLDLKGCPIENVELGKIRKGEKVHEELLTKSNNIILENDSLFVSFSPYINNERIEELKRDGFSVSTIESVSSNDKNLLLNDKQIAKILLKETEVK